MRARGYITADARNQTEYGTVRGYIAVGVRNEHLGKVNSKHSREPRLHPVGGLHVRSRSVVLRLLCGAAASYFGFYPQSDTGDGGKDVLAYTAQFGNGFSASIAAELPRRTADH